MLIFVFQMEIVEIVEGSLYAIKWQEDDMHSLSEMADKLTDVQWLYDYFENYKSRLSYFSEITIKKAVRKTTVEANELLQEILDLANSEGKEALDELFEPLHKEKAFNLFKILY